MPEDDIVQYQARISQDFLMTELSLAKTFCRIARDAATDEKHRRNLEHATAAYQTVLFYLKRVTLTATQAGEVESDLEGLKAQLVEAGISESELNQPPKFT